MKNVILTGASDGLGKSFAQLCIKNNINIIALCRTKPSYDCDFIKTDLSDENSVKNSCEIIKEKYSEFDAIINCAGTMSLQNTDSLSFEEMEKVYKVNSISPIYLISLLLPLIKKNKADIMNVTSIMGTMYDIEPGSITYTSSKWALRGASINIQSELKDLPCRVITFNPGGMKTNIFIKYNENLKDIGRDWMNTDEMADIMLYILNLPKQIEISEITISRKNNYN